MYKIVFSRDARDGWRLLSKKAPQSIKKLSALLLELKEHPRTEKIKLSSLCYLAKLEPAEGFVI